MDSDDERLEIDEEKPASESSAPVDGGWGLRASGSWPWRGRAVPAEPEPWLAGTFSPAEEEEEEEDGLSDRTEEDLYTGCGLEPGHELEEGELSDDGDQQMVDLTTTATGEVTAVESDMTLPTCRDEGNAETPDKVADEQRQERTSEEGDEPKHAKEETRCSDQEEDDAVYVREASPIQQPHYGQYYCDDYDQYYRRLGDYTELSRYHQWSSAEHSRRHPDNTKRHAHKEKRGHYVHKATPPRRLELCKFYAKECCAKRASCLYLHRSFPCKMYHTGAKCFSDDQCKFSHEPLTEITRAILLKHLETAPDQLLGDFPRMTRSKANRLIQDTIDKRRKGHEPSFTFPNMDSTRYTHLLQGSGDGVSESGDGERPAACGGAEGGSRGAGWPRRWQQPSDPAAERRSRHRQAGRERRRRRRCRTTHQRPHETTHQRPHESSHQRPHRHHHREATPQPTEEDGREAAAAENWYSSDEENVPPPLTEPPSTASAEPEAPQSVATDKAAAAAASSDVIEPEDAINRLLTVIRNGTSIGHWRKLDSCLSAGAVSSEPSSGQTQEVACGVRDPPPPADASSAAGLAGTWLPAEGEDAEMAACSPTRPDSPHADQPAGRDPARRPGDSDLRLNTPLRRHPSDSCYTALHGPSQGYPQQQLPEDSLQCSPQPDLLSGEPSMETNDEDLRVTGGDLCARDEDLRMTDGDLCARDEDLRSEVAGRQAGAACPQTPEPRLWPFLGELPLPFAPVHLEPCAEIWASVAAGPPRAWRLVPLHTCRPDYGGTRPAAAAAGRADPRLRPPLRPAPGPTRDPRSRPPPSRGQRSDPTATARDAAAASDPRHAAQTRPSVAQEPESSAHHSDRSAGGPGDTAWDSRNTADHARDRHSRNDAGSSGPHPWSSGQHPGYSAQDLPNSGHDSWNSGYRSGNSRHYVGNSGHDPRNSGQDSRCFGNQENSGYNPKKTGHDPRKRGHDPGNSEHNPRYTASNLNSTTGNSQEMSQQSWIPIHNAGGTGKAADWGEPEPRPWVCEVGGEVPSPRRALLTTPSVPPRPVTQGRGRAGSRYVWKAPGYGAQQQQKTSPRQQAPTERHPSQATGAEAPARHHTARPETPQARAAASGWTWTPPPPQQPPQQPPPQPPQPPPQQPQQGSDQSQDFPRRPQPPQQGSEQSQGFPRPPPPQQGSDQSQGFPRRTQPPQQGSEQSQGFPRPPADERRLQRFLSQPPPPLVLGGVTKASGRPGLLGAAPRRPPPLMAAIPVAARNKPPPTGKQ